MGKNVFLSYIRDDSVHVDELQHALEAADFTVWRDTKDLWPGENWELKIRDAIQSGSVVFLACFSSALKAREKSYQYAELILAAEEYRLRPADTSWLMTVRFDECEIPPVDLGGGRLLNKTIHRIDLFGEQKISQLARLVTAIHRVIEATPGAPSSVVLDAVATARRAEENSLDELRDLLRNPSLVMDYDAYMTSIRRPVLTQLADRVRFPMQGADSGLSAAEFARTWVDRIHDYETVIADLLEPLKLISSYGLSQHEPELTKSMRAVGQESTQPSGLNAYRYSHEYPALVLAYVCGLAAMSKRNYSLLRAATEDADVTVYGTRTPFVATAGAGSVVGDYPWLGSLLCQLDDGAEITDELVNGLTHGTIGGRYTPISDHIYTLLAPLFRDDFVSDEDYADAFDRVEVLLDAIGADTRAQVDGFRGGRSGYGRYTWRHRDGETPPELGMLTDLQAAGAGWTPLLGGMFGGNVERATHALEVVGENAMYFRERRW